LRSYRSGFMPIEGRTQTSGRFLFYRRGMHAGGHLALGACELVGALLFTHRPAVAGAPVDPLCTPVATAATGPAISAIHGVAHECVLQRRQPVERGGRQPTFLNRRERGSRPRTAAVPNRTHRGKRGRVATGYSMTASARSRNDSGIAKPSALAVLRFTTSLNFVGCSTGISAGLVPWRILSTRSAARR
jgi:hypothetical protein